MSDDAAWSRAWNDKLHPEINVMQDEIDALEADNARLREALAVAGKELSFLNIASWDKVQAILEATNEPD